MTCDAGPIPILIRPFMTILTMQITFTVLIVLSLKTYPSKMELVHICTLGKRRLQICLDQMLFKLIIYWQ